MIKLSHDTKLPEAITIDERPQNERHNRIFRKYVPKDKSIESYSEEQILEFADKMNNTPRKVLDYQTPDELFDEYLDEVYAA